MKKFLLGSTIFVAALFVTESPAFTQNAAACELPPGLDSPLEAGPFIVSTYHTSGVPGSDRVIQVQWPSEIKVRISGVPPGRTDGAERSMAFNIPNATASVKREDGSIDHVPFPNFLVFLEGGVDLYPLYSSLALVGGMSGFGELLDSGYGNTYHSSEGFEVFPDENHGDWMRYAYPTPNRVSSQYDTFFRGAPEVGGVEAILKCRRWAEGPEQYSQCQLFKKVEPIFYRSTFDGKFRPDVSIIETVSDALLDCILGNF